MKLKRIIVMVLSALILTSKCSAVNAEEIDEFIIFKENFNKSTKDNPVYTKESVKNGIIEIPKGTYDSVTISYNLKNVVISLNEAVITDKLIIGGNNKRKATIILDNKSRIGTVYTKRNTNIICSSSTARVGSVWIRGEKVSVSVNAITKTVWLLNDCTNATVSVNKKSKTIRDLGSENKITNSDEIKYVELTGNNSNHTALASVEEAFIGGSGNRLSIKSRKFGKVISEGNKSLIVGQTTDNKPIEMKPIEVNKGSFLLIRQELLSSVIDNRSSVSEEINYNKNVLFIGDSFIERLYSRGLLKTNMAILCAYGSAPSDWYLDGEKHLNYLNELSNYNPSKIVYYYGVNAIYDANNEEYSERLLTDLMGRYPAATIYVQKIFPLANNSSGVGQYDYDDYNHKAEYSIDRYNTELEQFCKKYTNLVWCDTTTEFLDGNGDLKRSKTVDGLHLSTEACKEWMNAIKKIIKE